MTKFYVYILQLNDSCNFYVGYTSNLKKRLFEHQNKGTFSTRNQNPQLKYFEIYGLKEAALSREKLLQWRAKNRKPWIIDSINEFKELHNLVKF